jgi:hypothetical protein
MAQRPPITVRIAGRARFGMGAIHPIGMSKRFL